MNGADAAFLVFAAGSWGVASELMRPGYFFPGVLGAGAVISGLFLLCARSAQPLSLAAGVAIAALFFFFEILWSARAVSGGVGALLLAVTLCRYSDAHPALVLPAILAQGTGVTYALSIAKRARLNKTI